MFEALNEQKTGLSSLAREVQQTLATGRQMADSTNVTLKTFHEVTARFNSGPKDPTAEPFRVQAYTDAAAQIHATATNGAIMFLPQKPYLPLGTLREVVAYPKGNDSLSDTQIAETLKLCRLEQFAHRLDERDNWALRLSPGEQQRLAIARALLNKPQWLFLDEATAALDEETERYVYQLLRHHLPSTTLVSIAHRPGVVAHHQRRITFTTDSMGIRLNTVRHSLCRYDIGFLLPPGEGQDEGEKERYSLLHSLTLTLSRREREFCTPLCPTSKFVPNTIGYALSRGRSARCKNLN